MTESLHTPDGAREEAESGASPRWEQSSARPEEPVPPELVLRLVRVSRITSEQARLGGRALLSATRHLQDMLDIAFRVGCRDGILEAGFVLRGLDALSLGHQAASIHRLLHATMPWLDFQLTSLEETPALRFPSGTPYASRLSVGGESDNGVRAEMGSPFAQAFLEHTGVVSVALGPSEEADGSIRLAADIVVAATESTEVLGALLPLELPTASFVRVEHFSGDQARQALRDHGFLAGSAIPSETLADLLALPARTRTPVAWSRVPIPPRDPEAVTSVFDQAPNLHRWVLGRTGSGKSTFLEASIRRDMEAGKCVIVLDPHGDLASRIPALVPPWRTEELTYADFGALDPPGINALQPEPGQSEAQVVNEASELLRDIWEDDAGENFFGPVFWRIFRFSIRLVQACGRRKALGEVVRILAGDEKFVDSLLDDAPEDLQRQWHLEIRQFVTTRKENYQVWLTGKLEGFVSDPMMSAIFDRWASSFSVGQIVRRGEILVCRVPMGSLGATAARILCTSLVSRVAGATGRRFAAGQPGAPVALYVDEWSHVAERPVSVLLRSGRKQLLEIVLASQGVAELRNPARIAQNVGTVAAFRLGPVEATLFEPEFGSLTAADLRTLPPHHVAVKCPSGEEVVGRAPAPSPVTKTPPAVGWPQEAAPDEEGELWEPESYQDEQVSPLEALIGKQPGRQKLWVP